MSKVNRFMLVVTSLLLIQFGFFVLVFLKVQPFFGLALFGINTGLIYLVHWPYILLFAPKNLFETEKQSKYLKLFALRFGFILIGMLLFIFTIYQLWKPLIIFSPIVSGTFIILADLFSAKRSAVNK